MPDAVSLNKFVIPESAGTSKSSCNDFLFLLLFPEGSVPF